VKLCTIAKGTSEIQRMVIGEASCEGVNASRSYLLYTDPYWLLTSNLDRLICGRVTPAHWRARHHCNRRINAPGAYAALLKSCYFLTAQATIIGLTGPPGQGRARWSIILHATPRSAADGWYSSPRSHQSLYRRRNSGRPHPHAEPSCRPGIYIRSMARAVAGGLAHHHC